MPPTLTERELKNKSTGIDILVPEYQIIPGKIVNTVLYHVIVITRLFYFKTRQHKESDLVQFAVAKKYEDVEDLHTKLSAKFPSVNFAPLPRLSLIINEKVLIERKKFLEQLLALVAKTPKLCSCSPILDFLEVNKISLKQNQLKPQTPDKPKEEVESNVAPEESSGDIFGDNQLTSSDEEESDDDDKDLSVVDMKRPPTKTTNTDEQVEESTSEKQDETDSFLKTTGKFSFGSHDVNESDVSDLFIPEEAKLQSTDTKLFVMDDDPDLLNIEDDLDKLLNMSKPATKPQPKPRVPQKPDLKPRPSAKPRFVETSNSGDEAFLAKRVTPTKPNASPRPRNKPVAPPKPVLHAKPVAPPKPVLHAKPVSPPKPGGQGETTAPPKPKPRTRAKEGEQSVKTASKSGIADDLQDIFNKPSRKDLFSSLADDDDNDEDLFKPEENVDVDDISQYIEQNMGKTSKDNEVDLFS